MHKSIRQFERNRPDSRPKPWRRSTVTIHAGSSGSPGSGLGTPTNPSSLHSAVNGVARYTANGKGIGLSANATCGVVIDVIGTGGGTVARALTLSDGEDGGEPGRGLVDCWFQENPPTPRKAIFSP